MRGGYGKNDEAVSYTVLLTGGETKDERRMRKKSNRIDGARGISVYCDLDQELCM
jgi:hypothetical protein